MFALLALACSKEAKLYFETQSIAQSTEAHFDLNYPKAMGTKGVADKINQHLEQAIVNLMNMSDTPGSKLTITDAIAQFDDEFKTFKQDFEDSSQQWEVLIDGQVEHTTPDLICVSLQSYVDTGGAHGNGGIMYLNFNPENGALFQDKDLISDMPEFMKIAEKAFHSQTQSEAEDTMEDFFFGEDFQLPANIGFGPDGLVLLYNNYEIASYAQGITKIIIPYGQVKQILKITP